jgi:uncharacterized membrane protein SpoIIM required for sporulation
MKVSDLLEVRQPQWRELESLCGRMQWRWGRAVSPHEAVRFASLYRATCADLALADAYQFPPATVHYLHQLVGRAHNQLYRARMFRFREWSAEIFLRVPGRLFRDKSLWLAMAIFWGVFILSGILAYRQPEFGQRVMGKAHVEYLETHYSTPLPERSADVDTAMGGFYILNNPSIGLRCFAFGLVFGIGGLFATVYNAALMGAMFGYMATMPYRGNFFIFVTAHGPFELTAVVLSAAAGMKMGFALVRTGGMERVASLRRAAQEAVPTVGVAVILFVLAAGIEAFLSPSRAPYAVKAAVAILATLLLVFYIVVLGYVGDRGANSPQRHKDTRQG